MKKILIIIIVLVVLGVGYYAISPLFNEIEKDDALPENIIESKMPSGIENLSEEQRKEFDKQMEEKKNAEVSEMNETMPQQEEGQIIRFPIMDTAAHPASGYVRVLNTESGKVIRYEEFETINGPNLHVYLATDLQASQYVDLGEIKGTKGNINYSIPDDVDIGQYKYVMYWCVPFKVLFNYAEIN